MKFRDLSINNNKLLAPFYSIIPVDIELKPLIDEEALNTRLLSRNQTKDSQFVDRRDRARHKTNNPLSTQ